MGRRCKNWLTSYLEYTKEYESPTSFHFWTGVATIAGALRRRVWFQQGLAQWAPNFYIFLVAPAGIAAKSTSINAGLALLRKVPGVYIGARNMTWQALVESMIEASQTVKYINKHKQEAEFTHSSITIPATELGTFLNTEDKTFVSALTDLWDSSPDTWNARTVSRGDREINGPFINIIGATTPAWLKNNIKEAMLHEGIASRIVFVVEHTKRHLRAYPDYNRTEEMEKLRDDLIADLIEMSTMVGSFSLDSDAYRFGESWYNHLWTEVQPNLSAERMSGYKARKQTHVHKLAMILSAAQSGSKVITEQHMRAAVQLATDLEPSMLETFENINIAPEAKHRNEIETLVKAFGKMSEEELWTRCYTTMRRQDFEVAVKGAVLGKKLRLIKHEGRTFITK